MRPPWLVTAQYRRYRRKRPARGRAGSHRSTGATAGGQAIKPRPWKLELVDSDTSASSRRSESLPSDVWPGNGILTQLIAGPETVIATRRELQVELRNGVPRPTEPPRSSQVRVRTTAGSKYCRAWQWPAELKLSQPLS